MRFAEEKTLLGWIYLGGKKEPISLTIRFRDAEVELNVLGDGIPGCTSTRLTGRNLKDCLYKILVEIGDPQTILEFHHTLDSPSSGRVHLIEQIRHIDPFDEDSYYDALCFRFASQLDFIEELPWEFSLRHPLFRFAAGESLPICCATCIHGHITVYGAEDDRHGLFCLREGAIAYESIKYARDKSVWAKYAYVDVDAFHCCEKYEARSKPGY